jgi:hypothetical protein
MPNRFYEVGWDVAPVECHFEILTALVVILLQGPSFIRMSFLHQVPDRSTLTSMQLPQYDKQEGNQTTKPRKTTEREATRHRKEQLHRKNTKRENDLALSTDVRSLCQKN